MGSGMIGGNNIFPMDGHPPRKDLMGGSALRKPRGAA